MIRKFNCPQLTLRWQHAVKVSIGVFYEFIDGHFTLHSRTSDYINVSHRLTGIRFHTVPNKVRYIFLGQIQTPQLARRTTIFSVFEMSECDPSARPFHNPGYGSTVVFTKQLIEWRQQRVRSEPDHLNTRNRLYNTSISYTFVSLD